MVYLDVEHAPFHLILAFSFAPNVLPSGDPYTSKMITEHLNFDPIGSISFVLVGNKLKPTSR